jgi:hypothetical protein
VSVEESATEIVKVKASVSIGELIVWLPAVTLMEELVPKNSRKSVLLPVMVYDWLGLSKVREAKVGVIGTVIKEIL